MPTTSPKPGEKAKAVEYRSLLSPLLRQLSIMHNNERRNLVPTCQQPGQTCRQFQVHTITPFNFLHLPWSTTNTVDHDRWRNWLAERQNLAHQCHPPAEKRLLSHHTSQYLARPWSPR